MRDTCFETTCKVGATVEAHNVVSHDISDNMELKHH